MNVDLIKLLAEDEVRRATQTDIEWPSLFSNNMVPHPKNIDIAIEYLSSLSRDELELRLAIFNWEDSAMSKYMDLTDSCSELLSRSIDTKDWAKLEISNIYLLLEKGIDQLLTPCDYFDSAGEMPNLYKNLLIGNWTNFLFFEELKLSLQAGFERQSARLLRWEWNNDLTDQDKNNLLTKIRENWEYLPIAEKIQRIKALPILWFHPDALSTDELRERLARALSVLDSKQSEEKLYERKEAVRDEVDIFFNKNWHLARDIQALIWYKNYLLEIYKNGADFSEENEYISDDEDFYDFEETPKTEAKKLHRVNDGYTAIVTSHQQYQSTHGRYPKVDELMRYMLENPTDGLVITGRRRGNRVEELNIEGVDKPIDRNAFRKRFERYFNN